ncbi:integral membrane protein [Actinoplanes cyaneus]|uniref:Integral membrane protein n=1 Tax=Actinoplanes cyaneus TaxID=52696 RepID=A0A919M908_9ACTN|nr:DoxX family protein [Actinoplanes cyaneus]MCW2136105.1 putative oxidoreductase [Actinoplanes cyaneus]GID62526.1 integral membrane protein [Actinoplanes cyaneus]
MSSPRVTRIVWPLFRVVIGLLFTCHGLSSLFGMFGGRGGTGATIPVGTWPGWYAAVIQLVCGVLVLLGLFTRPAAILASGSMAYAYFTVHQPDGLMPIENGGVTPALYSWTFLIIAVFGAGAWSLDELIAARRRPATITAEEKVTEPA